MLKCAEGCKLKIVLEKKKCHMVYMMKEEKGEARREEEEWKREKSKN